MINVYIGRACCNELNSLELSVFFILGYLLGLKRFPANYISLVIIVSIGQSVINKISRGYTSIIIETLFWQICVQRTFTVFEEKFKPEGYNYDVKVLGQSKFGGYWSQVMATPKVHPYDTYARSTGLAFIALAGYWVVSKYTKVGNYELY